MSGVLVETAVWVDHFRNCNEVLEDLLHQDLALTHPLVVGEKACGTPPAPRAQVLGDLEIDVPKIEGFAPEPVVSVINVFEVVPLLGRPPQRSVGETKAIALMRFFGARIQSEGV